MTLSYQNGLLKDIAEFADTAHGTQTLKYSSDRYIRHLVKVMKKCSQHTVDIAVLAAALLHDVLEDTTITVSQLELFLVDKMPEEIASRTLRIVTELTDVYISRRFPFLSRHERKTKETERLENASPEAQTVKYAEIIDNCLHIVDQDMDFAGGYIQESKELAEKLAKGNTALRQEALKTIDICMKLLR